MSNQGTGVTGARAATSGTGGQVCYGDLPAHYDRYAALTGEPLWAWLRGQLPRTPAGRPARVGRGLDVGCGTGLYTGLLANACSDVLAVDTSLPMLGYARTYRHRGNLTWAHRDLHELAPATDGRFDLVLCTNVLRDVPDPLRTLAHLGALVASDGLLLVADIVDYDTAGEIGAGVTRGHAELRALARRTFTADLVGRLGLPGRRTGRRDGRRTVGEAIELLRLSLNPQWLDLRAGEHLMTARAWDAYARTLFPGCIISRLGDSRTLTWRAAPSHGFGGAVGPHGPGRTPAGAPPQ